MNTVHIGGNVMKYKCLVLDHDDTAVKSTPEIHYPSFAEALKLLRPDVKMSLIEFVNYCFSPGFNELCRDILKFSDEEQKLQYSIWKSHTEAMVPDFYEGFPELLREYKNKGGIICVVSHSESEKIRKHYRLSVGFEPDSLFGWELEEDKRKPSSYSLKEIMRIYNLDNTEMLVVDDLKPGLDMARSCNVAFAAAGWSHMVPEIKEYMKMNSDYYLKEVEELVKLVDI